MPVLEGFTRTEDTPDWIRCWEREISGVPVYVVFTDDESESDVDEEFLTAILSDVDGVVAAARSAAEEHLGSDAFSEPSITLNPPDSMVVRFGECEVEGWGELGVGVDFTGFVVTGVTDFADAEDAEDAEAEHEGH
ncbi:hypothetical protein [Actinosynnema pretiosum]|uniref:Uncharacterized protein n=2 Tax=Actinosynnema TaxID=40566 RepID=A0A290Z3G3_9PSEU|nr:hypothetical protein [Actinosynnema pretiosum]ATE53532.1 hypothetical protein CNX65_09700 [Actinosynnema pretiosum]